MSKLHMLIHLSIFLKQLHVIPEACIRHKASSQATATKTVIQNHHLAVNHSENISATNLAADVMLIRENLKRNQDRQVC